MPLAKDRGKVFPRAASPCAAPHSPEEVSPPLPSRARRIKDCNLPSFLGSSKSLINNLHSDHSPFLRRRFSESQRTRVGQMPDHSTPNPRIIMNPSPSHTQPLPQAEDEPRIREYLGAAALIVGACASIAITFTAIATFYAADAAYKRVFRKGVRHVPR